MRFSGVSVAALALCAVAYAEEAAAEAAPEDANTEGAYSYNPGAGEKYDSSKKDEGKGGKSRKDLAEGHAFCEFDNCYEVLGVEPTAGMIAIKRAYRRFANEFHPDKCKSGNVEECRKLFPKYANAYEILTNTEMRKNYDYVLANPHEFPGFYMKFSKPVYAPKTDLRFVFVFSVLALAAAQHYIKKGMYEQALGNVKRDPRFKYTERLKAIMNASTSASSPKKSGTQRGESNSSKGKGGPKGEELEKKKKAAEEQLAADLAAELPPPPSIADNVAVSLFKLPLTLTYTAMWVMGGGMSDPAYKTRKALGLSAEDWETVDAEEQAELVGKELWVGENLEAYEEEMGLGGNKGQKSAKEKRAARERKRQARNPSAAVIED